MEKLKQVVTLLAIISMIGCSTREWHMEIISDMPVTDMHVVQFAIVEFDVKEKFIKEFYSGYLNEVLKTAKTDEERNLQTNITITTNWDLLFKKVTADNLYLLENKDTNTYGRTGGVFSHHAENIWLATKVFTINGKPYCYCIPFVAKNGSNLTCKLDSSNLISLGEVYGKEIKKGK